MTLNQQVWWRPIPASAYNGVSHNIVWPTFFLPIVKSIEIVAKSKRVDKHISTIIAAYLYGLQFTCDHDIINYIRSICNHQHDSYRRIFCEKYNQVHFGNCIVCMEMFDLKIQCSICTKNNCRIECLDCVHEDFSFCNECQQWHCNHSRETCYYCGLTMHWLHIYECQGVNAMCGKKVCSKCCLKTGFRVLCNQCRTYPLFW